MSAFEIIHHMENPIDYRPSVQHRLFKLDECFDFRLSAFNRVKYHYEALYREVIKLSHLDLFKEMRKYIQSHMNDDDEIIRFLSLHSRLSDIDSREMISSLENQFENNNNQDFLFISYNYNDYQSSSAHSVLRDISTKVNDKLQSKEIKKRSLSNDEIDNLSSKQRLWDLLKYHFSARREISSEELFPYKSLVIVINNFDILDIDLAGHVIRALVGYDVKIFIIGVSKAYSRSFSKMDESVKRILKFQQFWTVTSTELFDRFCHLLFTLPRTGPFISLGLVKRLSADFYSCHMCVNFFVQT